MQRFALFLLILGVGAAGLYFWKIHSPDRPEEAPVFHGNVDIREVRLGVRVFGRIQEVLKEEGDRVQAGEILARLDPEPFQNAVDQARAQVDQLGSRLHELRTGSRPEEISRARENLAEAEAALTNARLVHQRQQQLVASGAVSRQDYDSARTAHEAARARRDAVKANLDLLLAGTRQEQIDQAQKSLEAARAALAQTLTQLADTQLTAPEDGIVLTRVVEPGSMVQAGAAALTVSLMNPVRVRLYASEPLLGQIQPGRTMLIYTDSRPDPYHGRIGDVSARAEFTPKAVETEDLRTSLVYRFRVTVEDADQLLRQGMPVTARLAEEP